MNLSMAYVTLPAQKEKPLSKFLPGAKSIVTFYVLLIFYQANSVRKSIYFMALIETLRYPFCLI